MRFTSVSLLALPLLTVAAQESPLDQAKAQAQYWFNKIASYIPTPSVPEPAAAATTKPTVRPLHVLTLDNWKETIQSSVQLDSATPEEWWVFLTGGNKTCFGRCQGPETAFNETASLWASDPKAPHLGYIDCESQAVLCNSWGTGPLTLWIMEVPTPPAPVDIHVWNVNATTTTIKTFQDLRNSREWKEKPAYEGYYFHPFNGLLAQYNLAVPLGYFFWVFSVVPSWLFMIVISFFSRRMV
ncbi:hypothetical protein F5884DRAFT_783243 [Xylogone sp. PMI_703]|nr:hypothetical protein F5884DRAFT_783243 [Xylogone sp. PMI_703]